MKKNKNISLTKKEKLASNRITTNTIKRRKFIPFIIAGVIFAVLIFSYGWYSLVYVNRIYPNVVIGSTDFSGLSQENAIKKLDEQVKKINSNDIKLILSGNTWDIKTSDIGLNYDIEGTIEKIYSVGRRGNFFDNLKERVSLLFKNKNIDAIYSLDQNVISGKLAEIYSENETPVSDAKFIYSNDVVTIEPEKSGQTIDKAKLYADLDQNLSQLNSVYDINIILEDTYPKITENMLNNLKDQYVRALNNVIILNSEVKNITISKSQISSWIYTAAVFNEDQTGFIPKAHAEEESGNFSAQLEINQEEIRKFIDSIAGDINHDPKDARLSFSNGNVSVFQTPEKGYKVDEDQTVADITNLLISRMNVSRASNDKNTDENNNIELPLEITDPEVSDVNSETLGIKERIGTGTTSFSGSPDNRIHNIKNGANMFHGVVIKPGETLSAISILGNPSAETGYLPELVIKENKTLPEYGGGLCQVSTTLFRAALNAGLEILERTNHAYRVSYYEPPVGMDATVYYPQPDLVIKNNTDHYILIQTSVVGTQITFDLYGTKDGRNVEMSEPVVSETISPPKDVYIESSDLPAGTIKKQESSHAGAKASFYYKVIKDGKTLFEKTFNSVYKAWQGVYLFGTGTTLPDGVDAKDKDGNKVEGQKDAGGNKCSNECEEGWTECKDGGIRRCNKDGDCLKWSAVSSCGDGQTCSNNQCVNQ